MSRRSGAAPIELDGARALLGLPGVGAVTAARLAAAGLERLEQLAMFAPRRYDDAGGLRPIGEAIAGERVYLEGEVLRASVRRFFRRATLEVTIGDDTGRILLRWFRFRGPVPDRFALGRRVRAAGLVRAGKRGLELAQPIAEAVDQARRLDGRTALRARYAPIAGVPGSRVEQLCALAADASLAEPAYVPEGLVSLRDAARAVHLRIAPATPEARAALKAGQSPAHQRLAFEALLRLRLRARERLEERARPLLQARDAVLRRFFAALPFSATAAQRREIALIADELALERPMRRLLAGDVGSGKTLCAAAAFALCAAAGFRGALLLPTLLLAEQQADALGALLAHDGLRVGLLHGGSSSKARKTLAAMLADPAGAIDVVVGTHALLDEELAIAGLGLVVVDEQQRFGVAARAALVDKARRDGWTPHQLALSATPIPRTLALALRGALTVGRLDELPPGRAEIETVLLGDRDARELALAEARRALAAGGQVYWVCPQIDAGLGPGAVEAAGWLADRLDRPIALCHGRQAPAERRRQLAAFRAGAPVLCATTVVEVGLDVPGATLMVIESPERLGLSALHQLRGRVGRGDRAARCVLCAPRVGDAERARLEHLVASRDGLAIAEADLHRRGMGDLTGIAQSGMPDLPPLPPAALAELVQAADEAARRILERDPTLSEADHARLARALQSHESRSYDAVDGG